METDSERQVILDNYASAWIDYVESDWWTEHRKIHWKKYCLMRDSLYSDGFNLKKEIALNLLKDEIDSNCDSILSKFN